MASLRDEGGASAPAVLNAHPLNLADYAAFRMYEIGHEKVVGSYTT